MVSDRLVARAAALVLVGWAVVPVVARAADPAPVPGRPQLTDLAAAGSDAVEGPLDRGPDVGPVDRPDGIETQSRASKDTPADRDQRRSPAPPPAAPTAPAPPAESAPPSVSPAPPPAEAAPPPTPDVGPPTQGESVSGPVAPAPAPGRPAVAVPARTTSSKRGLARTDLGNTLTLVTGAVAVISGTKLYSRTKPRRSRSRFNSKPVKG